VGPVENVRPVENVGIEGDIGVLSLPGYPRIEDLGSKSKVEDRG